MIDQTYATSLNSLPSELHDHILRLACDGSCYPTPAISLSRVSRFWNTLARPHRYTVLRLRLKHIFTLLAQLQHLPPNDRRVRILRITDDVGRDSEEASNPSNSVEDDIRHQAYFIHLLTFVSPTLRSLSIRFNQFIYATPSLNHVWSTEFPELETLEMDGYYSFPRPPPVKQQTDADRMKSSTATNFPRLENLILNGVSNPFGLLGEGILDASVPHLKVLDIRGLRCAPFFALQIRDALSSRIAHCSWPNQSRGAVPPKLQSLHLTIESESNGDGRKVNRTEVLMREQTLREMDNLADFVAKAKWKEGQKVSVKLVRR